MEQLISLVSQKTGLPPEGARKAVETVLGFLKDKLPPAIGSQIDGVISSGGAAGGGAAGGLGDVAKGLGGMLGK